MTGLNPEVDCLVEIAVVITDTELNILDEGIDIIIKPTVEGLANMNEFVRNMHTESGLINEFESGVSLEEATTQVLAYIKRFVPEARTSPLGGNTIGTDRMFLARYMPEVDNHLHYRNIDVSSIKELSRRWYPRVYFNLPKKAGGHRALADIKESIQEFRYYRKTVFVDQPGPSSEQAKAAAESLGK